MDEITKKTTEAKEAEAVLTRRELLAALGGAAALSRFPPLMAAAAQGVASNAPLPPGVFAPSLDHLSHALNNNGQFVSIPPGAQTEYLRPRSGPFVPEAFTNDEFAAVKRLVEIIVGEDLKASAEARERGGPDSIYEEVAEWIDLLVASGPRVRAAAQKLSPEHRALAVAYFGSEEPVRKLETFEPERICREGLAWLREESRRRFAKDFAEVGNAQQVELVTSISDVREDKKATSAGTRFFDFLKAETIRGFYTSRAGLKELDYKANAFYAESPGCELT